MYSTIGAFSSTALSISGFSSFLGRFIDKPLPLALIIVLECVGSWFGFEASLLEVNILETETTT